MGSSLWVPQGVPIRGFPQGFPLRGSPNGAREWSSNVDPQGGSPSGVHEERALSVVAQRAVQEGWILKGVLAVGELKEDFLGGIPKGGLKRFTYGGSSKAGSQRRFSYEESPNDFPYNGPQVRVTEVGSPMGVPQDVLQTGSPS
jgi:hypothetical protein